jgi:hypothetical protein
VLSADAATAQVPEISARRLLYLRDRFSGRAWWQRQPRCPRCRTIVESFTRGDMTGPVVVPTGQGPGPCAEVISEYPVWLGPCGHQFRRIMRAKDYQ